MSDLRGTDESFIISRGDYNPDDSDFEEIHCRVELG